MTSSALGCVGSQEQQLQKSLTHINMDRLIGPRCSEEQQSREMFGGELTCPGALS